MSYIVAGIDPGNNAGFAVGQLDPVSGKVRLIDSRGVKLPLEKAQKLPALINAMRLWSEAHGTIERAVIERPFPVMDENGKIRSLEDYETQIFNRDIWLHAFNAVFGIWPTMIFPATWQSRVKVGKGKAGSLQTVRKLGLEVKDHNQAEAVLIMVFGCYRFGCETTDIKINIKENDSEAVKAFKTRLHARIIENQGVDPKKWRL